MIYSDTFRIIYYPIFKTGSRSLRELLIALFDCKYYGDTHDRETPDEMYEYNKISMVRNPINRSVSMWSHFKTANSHPFHEVKDMTFEKFMEWLVKHPEVKTHHLLMNQYDYLMGIELSKIYKIEELTYKIPRFNVGKHRSKHNRRTRELCREWAMDDFDFYGYK